MANLVDFNVINTRVQSYQKLLNLDRPSDAFPYVVLEALLEISTNEIENSIVDGSQDRGIDAIYIDDEHIGKNTDIHIFQFKYTSKQENINNNFPGGEIDKILTFIDDVLSRESTLHKEVNPALWRKIQDIQEVFNQQSQPNLIVHFCGNMLEMATHEKERIERSLRKYRIFSIRHHSLDTLVNEIALNSNRRVNGQFRFIDKQYFDRSAGNVRAVIGVISALDLVKLLEDKANAGKINEAIFEDNIRLYQGSDKNPINQAIYKSALDEVNGNNFFYLNNGLTITCDKIKFSDGLRHPLVELENMQIVNGSQTSHALFEAYQDVEDKNVLDNVLILIRVYETVSSEIVSKIVQTTNSQTVINSRDLRANDPIQYKLETELKDKGFYYARKKNSYSDQERDKVLDAQVVGQVLLTYYLNKPQEVKYRRREIFGKYYPDVFDESVINADYILTPMIIFQYIEKKKLEYQKEIRYDDYNSNLLFIPHASFYILHGIKVALKVSAKQCSYNNIEPIIHLYPQVINLLSSLVEEAEEKKGKKYSHNAFFRDASTVNKLEELIEKHIK